MATIRESPSPASQADIVNITRGAMRGVEDNWFGQRLSPMNTVNIMPSRHRRADKRCMRWKDRPVRTIANIMINREVTGVLWILTIIS